MLGCLFPVGIYAHLILSEVTDTDLIVPTLVNDASVFPLWATDFLIVSILAAAMSSMDSVLLVAASTLYKNIVAPFRGSSRELLWTRASVIGFSVLAALLALNPPGDIVEITIFSGSLYAVCFFPLWCSACIGSAAPPKRCFGQWPLASQLWSRGSQQI